MSSVSRNHCDNVLSTSKSLPAYLCPGVHYRSELKSCCGVGRSSCMHNRMIERLRMWEEIKDGKLMIHKIYAFGQNRTTELLKVPKSIKFTGDSPCIHFCWIISAYRKRCGKFQCFLTFGTLVFLHLFCPSESPASIVTDFPYHATNWNTPSFR